MSGENIFTAEHVQSIRARYKNEYVQALCESHEAMRAEMALLRGECDSYIGNYEEMRAERDGLRGELRASAMKREEAQRALQAGREER